MYKIWNEQMFYHKINENLVQERTTIGSLGSMTPISGGYQRRSISPLRFDFSGKQRPPRSNLTIDLKKEKRKKSEHPIHRTSKGKNESRGK